MGKNRLNKIKAIYGVAKYKTKEYKDMMDRATKIRFTPTDMANKIKNGFTPLTKGLKDNSRFKALTPELQQRAFQIVDEECNKKTEWAPKELPSLGRTIEKRLKKECA